MKRVFSLPLEESAELTLLQDLLEGAGIRCVMREEQLAFVLSTVSFTAELWVENDQDFARAQALYEVWRDPPLAATDSWICRQCGERLRLQFDSCWKCGHQKDLAPISSRPQPGNDLNTGRFVE